MAQQASISVQNGFVELCNGQWLLHVGIDKWLDPCRVVDLRRDAPLADEAYCYRLKLAPKGEAGFTGGRGITSGPAGELRAERVRFREWDWRELPGGGIEARFNGRFDFGLLGPTDIWLDHVFRLPGDADWFEEQITVRHRFGRDAHAVPEIRFAFRKTVFNRDAQCWLDGADKQSLVAVPHRRRWGQVVDHLAAAYSMSDIVPGNWSGKQLPGRAAEAWVWGDGRAGYLLAKYGREQMERGLVDGEFVLAPSKRGGDYHRTFDSKVAGGANVCLRWGGVGVSESIPCMGREIGPEAVQQYGVTRVYPVRGDWTAGYRVYKGFLLEKGHACPPDFDPPLHWNELYNLGWRGGDNTPLQELPELYAEAVIAQDIGAEAFYFDPVWDICEGSSIWDEARLGPLDQFVRTMRERYGLKTSLHLMMHTKSLDEDPRIYRRCKDGSVDLWEELYTGGRICAASPTWQQMKAERLIRLAEAGVTFMMFDFVSYRPIDTDIRRVGIPGSSCWDATHGHEVPLTVQSHAEGILKVIQAVKRAYPQMLIEAHDRVTGGMQDFHPLYFQHGLPHSFDENWGFEYMWDPFMDLLSGKALSLYEYNLAYDIPLYLHIHCGQDNDRMLAFWWYASTCRHLGIGGVNNPQSALYRAVKAAVTTYRRLKPYFARGRFVGVDPFIHGHALADGSAVFVLFNLGSETVTYDVSLPASDAGIEEIRSASHLGVLIEEGQLRFAVEVGPLSPALVEINTAW